MKITHTISLITKRQIRKVYPNGDVGIDTYEVFDFINHKGDLTHYKREKTYNLRLDYDGDLKFIVLK